jgi:ribosome maturation factor RimP
MGKNKKIIESLRPLMEPVIKELGMELINIEYLRAQQGMTLRLTIDKPGGVNLDDCDKASRIISDILDAQDFVPGPYLLEVSSPGINRALITEKDFETFKGNKAYIKLKEAINDRRRYRGILEGFNKGMVLMDSGGKMLSIPFNKIAKARLDII